MPVQVRRASLAYNSPHTSRSHNAPADVEKQRQSHSRVKSHHRDSFDSDSGNDGDDSFSSSAGSHQPMLGSWTRPRAGIGFYRVPNRIMRWLCLALLTFLVLLILMLFRFLFTGVADTIQSPKPKPPQWESFPFLKRYQGGIRSLVPRKENVPEYPGDGSEELGLGGGDTGADGPRVQTRDRSPTMASSVFNPYPDYSAQSYTEKYGEKRDCFLDENEKVRIPLVHHYPGVPRGFPDAVMGSNAMMGIRDDVCFDRFGRLGPYGLGYGAKKGGTGSGMEGDRDGAERVWEDYPPVDYRKVDWAAAQNRCLASNSHRFKDLPESRISRFYALPVGLPKQNPTLPAPKEQKEPPKTGTDRLPRNAVVIRTWHDFRFTNEDILYLRSLISELSLLSGGEYTIHFLVHVKDVNLPIWSDDETYQRVLNDALPEEFRGLGTLWSEAQMAIMYPDLEETWTRGLPIHGVYRSTYMCMQYFAYQHPEYDYYWNWEMDARYTGHFYHLFDKIVSWARKQPRKGLWERNARFYVPTEHGSWDEFTHLVRVQTERGTNSANNMWSAIKPQKDQSPQEKGALHQQGDKSIWGPERPDERDIFEVEGEGTPPTSIEKDRYEWGVGEEADLIVFNPLYDPEGTTWLLRDDVTGYNREHGLPPRRTAIITASRLSRKLLHTMHRETSLRRHSMFSEMWPATTALHHGFKAVYVPHSVYIDRRWPTDYLESVFNAGRNGASGGARTAIFGDREHNFRGTTWFYSAGFSPNLWRRWLGYKVDNDGGEDEELAGEGRMCLPPMLLHPVKDVDMVVDDGSAVG